MQITETQLRSVSRITRPLLSARLPLLSPACKFLLKWAGLHNTPTGKSMICEYLGGKMQIDLSSSIEFDVLFRGGHELSHLQLFREILKPGDTCLDIGANVGVHTLVMAKLVGPQGTVVALEPHPMLHRRLQQNIALNGYRQVTAIDKALCTEDGPVTLYSFAENARNQGVSSLRPNERTSGQTIRVAGINGSALLEQHDFTGCRLIKIDVEGMEPIALQELWPLIKRWSPYILFEYRQPRWKEQGAELTDWQKRFKEQGYNLFVSRRGHMSPLDNSAVPASCEIFCSPAVSVRMPRSRPIPHSILSFC